jgi:hypothetical protein
MGEKSWVQWDNYLLTHPVSTSFSGSLDGNSCFIGSSSFPGINWPLSTHSLLENTHWHYQLCQAGALTGDSGLRERLWAELGCVATVGESPLGAWQNCDGKGGDSNPQSWTSICNLVLASHLSQVGFHIGRWDNYIEKRRLWYYHQHQTWLLR